MLREEDKVNTKEEGGEENRGGEGGERETGDQMGPVEVSGKDAKESSHRENVMEMSNNIIGVM